MPSSASKSAGGGGRKRDRGRNPIPRARKKQKRLDAIRDNPLPPPPPPPRLDHDEESASLRRSSRPRRVPEVLDSSPVPSFRRKNPNPPDSSKGKRTSKGKEKVRSPLPLQEKPPRDWRLRLRHTAQKAGKGSRKGKEPLKAAETGEKDSGLLVSPGGEDGGEDEAEKELEDSEQKVENSEGTEKIDGNAMESEQMLNDNDGNAMESERISNDIELMPPAAEDSGPEKVKENLDGNAVESEQIPKEDGLMLPVEKELEDELISPVEKELEVPEQKVEPFQEKENLDGDAADELMLTVEKKLEAPEQKVEEDKVSNSRGKEGRRCGLCGGGTDGKPPKKLARESADSDDEAYAGSSASEEPNYDVWDGFGDEPGWLGKLLGPIRDRFGIARLWVHQHCAVWSPEVYFAGLGCLKNVRAALYRGRALKCSRCGRPGATIGCRVDRCLRTYHLPCSRAEGCIFDHRKFLIACNHHRHLFQPHGIQYTHQIRKRKAKKLKLEMRKLSSDAWRKDVEAEEKWLENCGEDEEFLKREGKRLHRDILRIAPTYIGGSSEKGNSYQGWESVAGLQDVIQCMKEVVILPLLYPDFFSNLGLAPPRGVLLHGYPGTGKTLVVRALVGACSRGDRRIAYFARKGADCLGKYVGDAERQLRLLFQVAERCQPSIIFFDEIDGLAPRRSRHQDQTHSSVVSTLLSLMDGLKSRGSVIVIGATNRPEAVDPALRRPGRFDREIYFPLPSEKDRSAILALHTQSWPNPVSGSLLSWIANQTVGYAGADLQALCTQAAMIGLKRNCALQDLLSCAEKGSLHGRRFSLPSFLVEERDWLAALTLAPPPCSRREAGMAANDAVSSPLPTHLTPCLLQPLVHILISFYNDERIWLPLALFKASKSVKRIIISALEQKQIPVTFWRSHFHLLIQEPDITSEIEKNLFRYGLVLGPYVVGHSYMSDDDGDDHERFHTFGLKHSAANVHNISMQKISLKQENLSGFRVLISGAPKSGQQHLASCLLHGFMGHIEILKVNLATISQEGHGDLLRGLTQILSKSVNVGRCMIYMPRIDLWAVSEALRQDVEESHNDAVTCKSSSTAGVHSGTIYATELWSAFVEQVESMSACTSLIIMATCEVQNQDLPHGIKHFFTNDVLACGQSGPLEHTIPRFLVHCGGGAFNHEVVISSFVKKLLHDLVQHYVQWVHHRSHACKSPNEKKVTIVSDMNSQSEKQRMENEHVTAVTDTSADPERIVSNSMASCRGDNAQQGINSDSLPLIRGPQNVGSQHSIHQDSFLKILPSKVTKGSSTIAIGTFGYQILRCPQFAELCWVTSKLSEGPCSDINGPWKGWPFNSCVMHEESSPDMVAAGVSSSSLKYREHTGVVRGLVAVGLLAYKGVYASVREVATEVRKVSELLVGQIREKILSRKDKYHYLRILSQIAYLEDMVNSWAYTFQRSNAGNLTTESNTKLAGRVYADNSLTSSNLANKLSCVPSSHEAQEALPEGRPEKVTTSKGRCINPIGGISDQALCNSDASIIPKPSAPCPTNLASHPLAVTSPAGGDESFIPVGTTPSKRLDSVKQFNGLELTHNSPSLETPDFPANVTKSSSEPIVHSNGLDTVLSSKNAEMDKPSELVDFKLRNSSLAMSENSCLYDCCSGCLHAVYMLAYDTVSQCWESSNCCSTIDDIHDTVSSCSSNLLAAFKQLCISGCSTNLMEFYNETQSEHCACQDLVKEKVKNMPSHYKSSRKMDYLTSECNCHSRNDEGSAVRQTDSTSPSRQSLTFIYRGGILVPVDQHEDGVLHCKYEKLCLCSIVEMLLTIKQPLR